MKGAEEPQKMKGGQANPKNRMGPTQPQKCEGGQANPKNQTGVNARSAQDT